MASCLYLPVFALSLLTINGCCPCLEFSGHREIVPEHTRWVGCELMLSHLVVAEWSLLVWLVSNSVDSFQR
jgi:hypothetical protein